MHDPGLTGCPTCGSPYCRKCYNALPKVKVGLLRKEPQCPKCAHATHGARAAYAPMDSGPRPPPPGPAPVVIHNYQATPQMPPAPPPQIMFRCRYCHTVYPEVHGKCPSCGAGF